MRLLIHRNVLTGVEVLWELLVDKSLEHLVLYQGEQSDAQGLVVGMLEGVAYRIQFQIICDAKWNTLRVNAKDLLNGKEFTLTRSGDECLDERDLAIESLRGCIDVDIRVTPFKNTLPIQRLNLEPGESNEIEVVQVAAPELSLSKFEQRYTCLSKNKNGGVYKYESLNSRFMSELRVDSDGFVLDYPGIFKIVWKNTKRICLYSPHRITPLTITPLAKQRQWILFNDFLYCDK